MTVRIPPRLKSALPAIAGAATACVLFAVVALVLVKLPSVDSASSINDQSATDQFKQQELEQLGAHSEGSVSQPTPRVASIGELLDIESEYLRNVTLRHMLASTDQPGAQELLNQTETIAPPNLRQRLQKQILQKLASEDPLQLLTHAQANPTSNRIHAVEAVFEALAMSSLDEVVMQAETLADQERLAVLETVFRTRDDLSAADLSRFAHEFGYGGRFVALSEELAVRSATQDPEASWNQVLEDSWKDYGQVWSLVAIADAWIAAEGPDVIYQAAESLTNHRTRTEVIRRLLGQMAGESAPEAFELARSLREQTDDSIFRTIVSRWAASDPLSAMNAAASLKDETLVPRLQTIVAERWAQTDPNQLLQNIAAFPATAQTKARGIAIGVIAMSAPQDAIKALALLPEEEIENAAERVARSWAMNSVRDVVDWIQSDSTVQAYRGSLFSVVLEELVRTDPEEAMRLALDQPSDPSSPHLEYQVIHKLIEDNEIEQSLKLLPNMRESVGQFNAFVLVGIQLIVNKDIERALALGEQLDASRRDDFLKRLLNGWAYSDAQGLFLSLETLPNLQTQRLAADALAKYPKTLNETQLSYIATLTDKKPRSR